MTSGHGSKLPQLWEQALAALVEHPGIPEAAAAIGVHHQTLRQWLREEPKFRAEYAALRRQLLGETLHRVQAECARAVATLGELLKDDHPGAVRCRAALGVLQVALRGTEALDCVDEVDGMMQDYFTFKEREQEILGKLARLAELERREQQRAGQDAKDAEARHARQQEDQRQQAERAEAMRQAEEQERQRRRQEREAKERPEQEEVDPDCFVG
jgi:hypothetical protein